MTNSFSSGQYQHRKYNTCASTAWPRRACNTVLFTCLTCVCVGSTRACASCVSVASRRLSAPTLHVTSRVREWCAREWRVAPFGRSAVRERVMFAHARVMSAHTHTCCVVRIACAWCWPLESDAPGAWLFNASSRTHSFTKRKKITSNSHTHTDCIRMRSV